MSHNEKKKSDGDPRNTVRIVLPPHWQGATDPYGRVYFYNTITRESQWEPPPPPDQLEIDAGRIVLGNVDRMEMEVLDDQPGPSGSSGDKREAETDLEMLSSDLSPREKELLLRKRSREERHSARRAKEEDGDREKLELERKQRYDKHKRSGLVTEHLVSSRSNSDKDGVSTFSELRDRLSNRRAIFEQQMREEREEEEADRKRARSEERMKRENERTAASAAAVSANPDNIDPAKKAKDDFKKAASAAIVKMLTPFQRSSVTRGRITTNDDFKHLARKLTQYILVKEMQRCQDVEALTFSESVRKKTWEYVKSFMSKYDGAYKRSPN